MVTLCSFQNIFHFKNTLLKKWAVQKLKMFWRQVVSSFTTCFMTLTPFRESPLLLRADFDTDKLQFSRGEKSKWNSWIILVSEWGGKECFSGWSNRTMSCILPTQFQISSTIYGPPSHTKSLSLSVESISPKHN